MKEFTLRVLRGLEGHGVVHLDSLLDFVESAVDDFVVHDGNSCVCCERVISFMRKCQ